jgi:hypothetical protein
VISADLEAPRPATGEAFTDAITYAWGDPAAGSFGLARLGWAPGAARASALAVVFSGADTVAAVAQSSPLEAPPDWASFAWEGDGAKLATRTQRPLEAWTLSLSSGDVEAELAFAAIGPPAELLAGSAAAQAGGIEAYEQPCVVAGTVRAGGGDEITIEGRGQRGHGWGEVDWSRMENARTVSVWLEDGRSFVASAIRPPKAKGHEDDAITAYFLDPGDEGGVAGEDGEGDGDGDGADAGSGGSAPARPEPEPLHEARISTAYDTDGRQRRAGLELYETESTQIPRRGAGTLLCGTTLDLGDLRLDTAFFDWSLSGNDGVGRYDQLRHK